MAYTVFARKYRPQIFAELVGQEHVARTLANAIASGRVAHAFLFTGVRGVGKTTTARLLAKCLNCDAGPTTTPCNACGPCVDITAGRDVDVQEIDGASNNGVEDVRRLQETLPYRPARDRFKIVIVDEVHMLSTGAFNAFLKTLEEPPSHVKFIFATTESHRVPITIRSRCQRYDFRLIPQAVIAERVRAILEKEGLGADDAAIGIVAREAAGSMRDALTLLDQLAASSGEALIGAEVARALGIAGLEHLHRVADTVLRGDPRGLLEAVNALAEQGVDPLHFGRQLLGLLRDLVVLSVTGEASALVDLVDEERAWATDLSREVTTLELERAFAQVSKIVDEVARAGMPHTALEMGLLRVATRPRLEPIAELLSRLEALEQKVRGSSSGPDPGAGPGGGARGPARSRGTRPESAGGTRSATSGGALPEPPQESAPPTHSSGSFAAVAPQAATAPANIVHSPAIAAAIALSRAATPAMASAAERMDVQTLSEAPPAPETLLPSPNPETSAPSHPRLLRPALQEWERIVRHVREAEPGLGTFLGYAVPQRVTAERVVLSFPDGSFYGRKVSTPAAKSAIAEAALALLGGRPEVEVRFDASPDQTERTVATVEAKRRGAEAERKRREALNHPVVLDALEVFPEARGQVDVETE